MKKAIFLSAVRALYKVDEADLAEDLKEAVEGDEVNDDVVEKIFVKLDANKVTSLKDEARERFDNGIKKGQKETAKKFEKKLKATFEIDDDSLEGDALLSKVEEVANEHKSKSSGSGDKPDLNKITPEDLEKIPAFINKQREFSTQLKAKDTEKEEAVKEIQEQIKKGEVKSKVFKKALEKLNERNPILPADASKAEKHKKKFLLDELENIPFMLAEDGAIVPLDEEGKARKNKNGIDVDFNMLVDSIIDDNFEFAKTNPKNSPSNKNDKSNPEAKKFTGKAPTSSKEYFDLITDEELSTEEKAEIIEEYRDKFN